MPFAAAEFAAGLIDEVRGLAEKGSDTFSLGRTASQAVGYREATEVLADRLSLLEAIELTKTRTRRFAKRQLTWLRRRECATWVDSAQTDPTLAIVHALSAGGFAGWSYA